MRNVLPGGLRGGHHRLLDLLVGDLPLGAGPVLVNQPVQAALDERERHLPTAGRDTPDDTAISTLDIPSAYVGTIRLRNVND